MIDQNDTIKVVLNGANNEIINIGFVNINTLERQIISCDFDDTLMLTIECHTSNQNMFTCVCTH